jgi:hypothetical protein
MRAVSFIVSVLLAGSAYAQAPASVYTPAQRDLGVPTFINATVVRVDARHHTVTFRSESREVTLTAEGDAVAGLGRLRPGDEVILGYRVDDRSGRPVQIVTAILAGEEMARRGFVTTNSPVATASTSTVTGRVVSVDRAAGTFTMVDSEGRTEMLAAQGSALSALGTVLPGDQLDVAFIPGAPVLGAGVVGVGGIFGVANGLQVATTPTFVTGGVTAVDANTGAVTLRTPFGEQIFTLPPSTTVPRLGTLRVGQTVRLDLTGNGRSFSTMSALTPRAGTVSTAGTRAGALTTSRGTFALPLTSSTGTGTAGTANTSGRVLSGRTGTVSTLGSTTSTSGTIASAGTVGAVGSAGTVGSVGTVGRVGTVGTVGTAGTVGTVGTAGTVGGTVPTTTGTMAGVLPQRASGVLTTGAVTVPTTSVGTLSNTGTLAAGNPNAAGLPGGVNTNTVGTAGVNAAGTVSFPGAVTTATTDLGSTGTIALGGSPFASVIPSLPSVVGQLNVVPPPALAPASPETLPVGAARDLASRDYDAGVRAMALKANEIDAHWFRYRDGCLRSNSTSSDIDRGLFATNRDREWFVLFNEDVRTPADDNCRQLRVELNRMAEDWRDTMTRLEDTARKNDVLPGAMRDTRQRYRVEF